MKIVIFFFHFWNDTFDSVETLRNLRAKFVTKIRYEVLTSATVKVSFFWAGWAGP